MVLAFNFTSSHHMPKALSNVPLPHSIFFLFQFPATSPDHPLTLHFFLVFVRNQSKNIGSVPNRRRDIKIRESFCTRSNFISCFLLRLPFYTVLPGFINIQPMPAKPLSIISIVCSLMYVAHSKPPR